MFVATVWPHPAFAGSGVLPRQRGGVSGGVNGGVKKLGRGTMARRREAILKQLGSGDAISVRELGGQRKRSGSSPAASHRSLSPLGTILLQ